MAGNNISVFQGNGHEALDKIKSYLKPDGEIEVLPLTGKMKLHYNDKTKAIEIDMQAVGLPHPGQKSVDKYLEEGRRFYVLAVPVSSIIPHTTPSESSEKVPVKPSRKRKKS